MTRALRLLLLVCATLSLLALGACKQQEGKTCQTTSDCNDGLVCCFDGQSSASTLGTCVPEVECGPLPDAAVSEDASP